MTWEQKFEAIGLWQFAGSLMSDPLRITVNQPSQSSQNPGTLNDPHLDKFLCPCALPKGRDWTLGKAADWPWMRGDADCGDNTVGLLAIQKSWSRTGNQSQIISMQLCGIMSPFHCWRVLQRDGHNTWQTETRNRPARFKFHFRTSSVNVWRS